MIGLPQIQAFLEVARSGSFANASRRLSLPRSTVSARIRALEDALKVRLLQRTTRRVALTDEGRRYMDRCEEVIDKLVLAESELTQPGEISGTVRITAPADMPKGPLGNVLSRFVELHPAVRVEVSVTDDVVDLIANNLDVALRGGAPGSKGLIARKLGECAVSFYASPRYCATRVPGQTLTDGSEHVIYDPARRLPRSSNLQPLAAAIVTRSLELAKLLAIQSQGVALLPDNICREAVQAGSLLRLSYAPPLLALPLYAVMPSRAHVPARVRALVDFLAQSQNRAALL